MNRARSFLVAAACLYLPFSWLVLSGNPWIAYQLAWIRPWPVLPGFVPGALLFHPNDALKFTAMGIATAILLAALTAFGASSRGKLAASALVAMLISVPASFATFGVFHA